MVCPSFQLWFTKNYIFNVSPLSNLRVTYVLMIPPPLHSGKKSNTFGIMTMKIYRENTISYNSLFDSNSNKPFVADSLYVSEPSTCPAELVIQELLHGLRCNHVVVRMILQIWYQRSRKSIPKPQKSTTLDNNGGTLHAQRSASSKLPTKGFNYP